MKGVLTFGLTQFGSSKSVDKKEINNKTYEVCDSKIKNYLFFSVK